MKRVIQMTQHTEELLNIRIIGTKHFSGVIQITDPCYNNGTLYRTAVEVVSGDYVCAAWEHTEHVNCDDYSFDDTRVFRAGIYLNGDIPDDTDMEEIVSIGVDSGLAGFFTEKPNYTREAWLSFCDTIQDGNAWLCENGFLTSTAYGDGLYSLLAYRENGKITALELMFY